MLIVFFLAQCCCLTGGGRTGPAIVQTGMASYYGDEFHGRKTASGELYDRQGFTCAHKKLPFGTKLKVTNLKNNRTVVVRVNDRGPWVKNRIIDLSYAAAKEINMIADGVVKVRIEVVE